MAKAAPVQLTIFAAASLTEPFKEIGANFTKDHPETTFSFNFGGSQNLEAQLEQGARADVFASASPKYMDNATTAGLVTAGTAQTFAHNRLVVIFPKNNPANIHTLHDLAKPGVKVVLADKSVPVGQYALTFLQKAAQDVTYGSSYQANVLKNVVSYEQDVKSVLSKVQVGEADAGIVYVSDISQTAATSVSKLDIPDAYNTIATYPIAILKATTNAARAQQFVTYVLSAAGQRVLAKYNFIPTATLATSLTPIQRLAA